MKGKRSKNKRGVKKAPRASVVARAQDRKTLKLKRVHCVECLLDGVLKRMSTCEQCQYHEKSECAYSKQPYRVSIVSMKEPQKYNRLTHSVSSSFIQDDARNYYFLTEIMQPTKHIGDCPQYTKLKEMLIKGELREDKIDEPRFVTEIKGILYLEEATEGEVCFYNGGKSYKEVPEFYTGEAQWRILFYLYEMFSFDGLADIKIDDRFYKIKGKPIVGYPHSLVVAINGKNIVIGV